MDDRLPGELQSGQIYSCLLPGSVADLGTRIWHFSASHRDRAKVPFSAISALRSFCNKFTSKLITSRSVGLARSANTEVARVSGECQNCSWSGTPSQLAVGEWSVCDRIAFAWWESSNRTACQPRREKSRKASLWLRQSLFSESGLVVKRVELRGFLAIFTYKLQRFSALETCWRRELDSNL